MLKEHPEELIEQETGKPAQPDENRHARRRRAALTRKLLRDVKAGKVPSPFAAP